jgi:DNA-binding NarL/FixJ family response regulator
MPKILIADPDVASRKALALLISRRLGILDAQEAGDSEALICSLSEEPPDILLLDWRLHGAPVLETCRLIHKAYPGLKIILLSMDAQNSKAAQSVGATFIHKGAGPEGVIAVLRQTLGIEKQAHL